MQNTFAPHVLLANQIIEQGKSVGILHNVIQNHATDGKTVLLKNGKKVTYFGNCNYLSLEHDPRLKTAAIEAIERYGIQFSCSRTYASLPYYEELEVLLSQIFGKPTIAAPTTTLAHMAVMPVLVQREDAIILDQQCHASIQNAAAVAKSMGTYVEMIRHNRVDMLENRIQKLKDKYQRIWFMTDGVYSMFGDAAPLSNLYELQKKYEQLYLYVDDAHGMSWKGTHGSGFALSQMPEFPDKMVLLTSLAKGFGACGAAIVLPNTEWRDIVLNVGPTLMFSGPLQPATLAAMIASAKIHLTPEITQKQEHLSKLMSYFMITAKAFKLPLVNEDKTPVFFIGVGTPDTGAEISQRMMHSGYLLNPSSFPSVPYKNTGLRSTLTTYITQQDIYDMLSTFANHLEDMEKKNQVSKAEIYKAFAMTA